MKESNIENYLTAKIKKLGGLTFKFTSPNCAGVPDRIVILNGSIHFVELKAPGKRPRPLQAATFADLAKQQVPVFVLDSTDSVDSFLKEVRA